MDRLALSEDSRHEVGMLFEAALRAAAVDVSADDLAGLERRLQAVGRAVLGRVVERVVGARAVRAGTDRRPCPPCAGPMRRVALRRTRHMQGGVGGVGGVGDDTIRRPYDRCAACAPRALLAGVAGRAARPRTSPRHGPPAPILSRAGTRRHCGTTLSAIRSA